MIKDQGGKQIEELIESMAKMSMGSKHSRKTSRERTGFRLGSGGEEQRLVGFVAEFSQVWRLESK